MILPPFWRTRGASPRENLRSIFCLALYFFACFIFDETEAVTAEPG